VDDQDTALLVRLEAERDQLETRLVIARERLSADPGSDSKRDAVAELKRAAERWQMMVTKLRSLE
jgi:hypothetical protein